MNRPDPLADVPDEQLRLPDRIRPVQYFSDAYLQRCRRLRTEDIVRFLEEFRLNCAGTVGTNPAQTAVWLAAQVEARE